MIKPVYQYTYIYKIYFQYVREHNLWACCQFNIVKEI